MVRAAFLSGIWPWPWVTAPGRKPRGEGLVTQEGGVGCSLANASGSAFAALLALNLVVGCP